MAEERAEGKLHRTKHNDHSKLAEAICSHGRRLCQGYGFQSFIGLPRFHRSHQLNAD